MVQAGVVQAGVSGWCWLVLLLACELSGSISTEMSAGKRMKSWKGGQKQANFIRRIGADDESSGTGISDAATWAQLSGGWPVWRDGRRFAPNANGYCGIFTVQMFDRTSISRITSRFRDTAIRVSGQMK